MLWIVPAFLQIVVLLCMYVLYLCNAIFLKDLPCPFCCLLVNSIFPFVSFYSIFSCLIPVYSCFVFLNVSIPLFILFCFYILLLWNTCFCYNHAFLPFLTVFSPILYVCVLCLFVYCFTFLPVMLVFLVSFLDYNFVLNLLFYILFLNHFYCIFFKHVFLSFNIFVLCIVFYSILYLCLWSL